MEMWVIGRWIWLTLTFIITAYQIWKSLKPDFPQEEIFAFIWRLYTVGTIGALIVRGEVWGMVLGGLIVCGWWVKKMDWDAWDLGDILVPNLLLFGLATGWTFGEKGWFSSIIYGLGYLGLRYVRFAYRKFTWYKSGRAGLVFLCGLIWIGISEIAIAFFTGDRVYYWKGLSAGQIVSGWLISFGLIGIYFRSQYKK